MEVEYRPLEDHFRQQGGSAQRVTCKYIHSKFNVRQVMWI